MPLVSVIIPTYNRSQLVVEAVDSTLRQTMKDLEVIVVDDGSTDGTRTVVEAIKDERVRYFYKPNGGVSTARNLGLTKAAGDYICFLDSDDLWPPKFLEVMLNALGKNPDYGAAYCARTILYPDGTKVESHEKELCKSGSLTRDLFQKAFIQTSTLCFRRNVLSAFSFEERLRNAQDVDAWLRLSTKTKYLFVPDIEILFRQDHGVTERVHHSRLNCNRVLLLERFYFGLGGDKYVRKTAAFRKLSHACRSVAEVMRKKGARNAATFMYKRAIKYRPLDLKLYVGYLRSILLSNKKDPLPDWQMPEPLSLPAVIGGDRIPEPKSITNIVFTKNRPLQLDAYLTSLHANIPKEYIQTYIFYKAELFESEYECVFRDFPECIVVREADFHNDFLKLLSSVETEYILFGTDDVVYYDSININVIKEAFRMFQGEILGFSLRLAPKSLVESGDIITECQAAGESVWKINWKKASNHTARYPFELNSTIYRTELVKEIVSRVARGRPLLQKIFRKDSRRVRFLKSLISMKDFLISLETFRKPNTLEGYACRWCKNHKSRLPSYFYFQKLCASAIQVNIVNTEIDNPIFGDREHTVEALNDKYRNGYRVDINAIKTHKPNKTHVGPEFFNVKNIAL